MNGIGTEKIIRRHTYENLKYRKYPKKQPQVRPSRKVFSTGEKFLFVLFAAILVLFSTMILHTQAQINDTNQGSAIDREGYCRNNKTEYGIVHPSEREIHI